MNTAFLADARARWESLIAGRTQVSWTLADQVIVSGANFLTALIVARFLGLESFGVFSLAWLILLFVQSFQIALILTPMLSIGPKRAGSDAASYYSSLLPLQAVFAVLAGTFAAAISLLGGSWIGMGSSGTALALPLAFAVAATQMHEFFRRYCFARGRPIAALWMDAVRYVIQIIALLYVFLAARGSIESVLLVVATSAALVGCVLVWIFPHAWVSLQNAGTTIARHWNMSKWLFPSALMQWTSGNFFTLAAGQCSAQLR